MRAKERLRQEAGGARGATLRSTTKKITAGTNESSMRLTEGANSRVRESVKIAMFAPEQIGQACESGAGEFIFSQQCSCPEKGTREEHGQDAR
jgi:hypothetical protein